MTGRRTGGSKPGQGVGWARLRVLGGFAAFGAFWGSWGSILPLVQAHADVTDGQLGTALLLIGLGALATMRLTGFFLDRYGRLTEALAAFAFGVLGFLPALAASYAGLCGVLLLLGGASGATDVAINAVAVDFESRYSKKVLGKAHATFSALVVLASLAMAVLSTEGVSLVGLLFVSQSTVVLISLLLLPSRKPWAAPQSKSPQAKPVRLFAIPRSLLGLGALGALAYLLENAWQSWGAILLGTTYHANAGISLSAPAVFASMAVVGRLLGDRASTRVGAKPILGCGATIAAVGSLAAAHSPDWIFALAGIGVAGFGTSVCAPTIISLAGRTKTGLLPASSVSLVTNLSYIGFLLGPPLVGLVANHGGLSRSFDVVTFIAIALVLGATVLLPRDRSQSRSA